MPGVALTRCQRCQNTSEYLIAHGPIPVISTCPCGGTRQVSRILYRPRKRAPAAGGWQDFPSKPATSRPG